VSLVATKTSVCIAKCGRLIRPGDAYEPIVGTGGFVHPGCVDRYERLLAREVAPVRNAPQSARAGEFVEHTCERCGQHFAGRRGDVVDRCRVPAHVLPEGVKPIGPGDTCGGRLVQVGEDLLPATTAEGDAGSRESAGSVEPARSRSASPLRSRDPQLGLGDVPPEPAGESGERGGAREERNAPSGEEADQ
jgi:hypothetical protein